MKLCIAGKNNIAVDCLLYALLFFKKDDMCVVVNKTDNFKNTWQKSLGFYAKLNEVEIVTIEDIQKEENLVFISLEFDKIIKPDCFKSKLLYNIHFSLLPEYKGMYTSIFPILHNKSYSGVTLHYIDCGIDTGDIIEQVKFDIMNLTSQELYLKYLEVGKNLVCKNLLKLVNGNIEPIQQPTNNSTYFSKRSFKFDNVQIEVKQTAYQIDTFVRALNFRVYQLPKYNGIPIFKSKITKNRSLEKPGTIISEDMNYLEISTIDYNILLFKDYYDELIRCCRNDDLCKGKLIIRFIQNINEYNADGWNPIIIACYSGADKMVDLLLENGADPNSTNLNGTTTLMYAKDSYLKTRDFSIINSLLKKNVNVDAVDIFGKSIFDYIKEETALLNFLKNYKERDI